MDKTQSSANIEKEMAKSNEATCSQSETDGFIKQTDKLTDGQNLVSEAGQEKVHDGKGVIGVCCRPEWVDGGCRNPV